MSGLAAFSSPMTVETLKSFAVSLKATLQALAVPDPELSTFNQSIDENEYNKQLPENQRITASLIEEAALNPQPKRKRTIDSAELGPYFWPAATGHPDETNTSPPIESYKRMKCSGGDFQPATTGWAWAANTNVDTNAHFFQLPWDQNDWIKTQKRLRKLVDVRNSIERNNIERKRQVALGNQRWTALCGDLEPATSQSLRTSSILKTCDEQLQGVCELTEHIFQKDKGLFALPWSSVPRFVGILKTVHEMFPEETDDHLTKTMCDRLSRLQRENSDLARQSIPSEAHEQQRLAAAPRKPFGVSMICNWFKQSDWQDLLSKAESFCADPSIWHIDLCFSETVQLPEELVVGVCLVCVKAIERLFAFIDRPGHGSGSQSVICHNLIPLCRGIFALIKHQLPPKFILGIIAAAESLNKHRNVSVAMLLRDGKAALMKLPSDSLFPDEVSFSELVGMYEYILDIIIDAQFDSPNWHETHFTESPSGMWTLPDDGFLELKENRLGWDQYSKPKFVCDEWRGSYEPDKPQYCPRGDDCPLLHPDMFNKGYCKDWLHNKCANIDCLYAHDDPVYPRNMHVAVNGPDSFKNIVICRYWQKDACNRPDCANKHALPNGKENFCCPFFARGKCLNDPERCLYKHDLKAPPLRPLHSAVFDPESPYDMPDRRPLSNSRRMCGAGVRYICQNMMELGKCWRGDMCWLEHDLKGVEKRYTKGSNTPILTVTDPSVVTPASIRKCKFFPNCRNARCRNLHPGPNDSGPSIKPEECTYGEECSFFKEGKCKNLHPAKKLPPVPVEKMVWRDWADEEELVKGTASERKMHDAVRKGAVYTDDRITMLFIPQDEEELVEKFQTFWDIRFVDLSARSRTAIPVPTKTQVPSTAVPERKVAPSIPGPQKNVERAAPPQAPGNLATANPGTSLLPTMKELQNMVALTQQAGGFPSQNFGQNGWTGPMLHNSQQQQYGNMNYPFPNTGYGMMPYGNAQQQQFGNMNYTGPNTSYGSMSYGQAQQHSGYMGFTGPVGPYGRSGPATPFGQGQSNLPMPQQRSTLRPNGFTCYNCHEPGHKQQNCPHPRRAQNGHRQMTPQSNMSSPASRFASSASSPATRQSTPASDYGSQPVAQQNRLDVPRGVTIPTGPKRMQDHSPRSLYTPPPNRSSSSIGEKRKAGGGDEPEFAPNKKQKMGPNRPYSSIGEKRKAGGSDEPDSAPNKKQKVGTTADAQLQRSGASAPSGSQVTSQTPSRAPPRGRQTTSRTTDTPTPRDVSPAELERRRKRAEKWGKK